MIERKYLEKDIKPICEEWFYNLPALYKDLYYKVFNENNRYKYSKKIQYCIDDNTEEYSSLTIMGKAHVYMAEAGALDISYISPISSDFDKKDIELGLQKIVTGEMFAPSILNMEPTLNYDGIRCFLYQGICEAMGFKCEGITINNGSERLFI